MKRWILLMAGGVAMGIQGIFSVHSWAEPGPWNQNDPLPPCNYTMSGFEYDHCDAPGWSDLRERNRQFSYAFKRYYQFLGLEEDGDAFNCQCPYAASATATCPTKTLTHTWSSEITGETGTEEAKFGFSISEGESVEREYGGHQATATKNTWAWAFIEKWRSKEWEKRQYQKWNCGQPKVLDRSCDWEKVEDLCGTKTVYEVFWRNSSRSNIPCGEQAHPPPGTPPS